jgi:hypothetical protein
LSRTASCLCRRMRPQKKTTAKGNPSPQVQPVELQGHLIRRQIGVGARDMDGGRGVGVGISSRPTATRTATQTNGKLNGHQFSPWRSRSFHTYLPPGRVQTAKKAKELRRRKPVVSRRRETSRRGAGVHRVVTRGASGQTLTSKLAKVCWPTCSSRGTLAHYRPSKVFIGIERRSLPSARNAVPGRALWPTYCRILRQRRVDERH